MNEMTLAMQPGCSPYSLMNGLGFLVWLVAAALLFGIGLHFYERSCVKSRQEQFSRIIQTLMALIPTATVRHDFQFLSRAACLLGSAGWGTVVVVVYDHQQWWDILSYNTSTQQWHMLDQRIDNPISNAGLGTMSDVPLQWVSIDRPPHSGYLIDPDLAVLCRDFLTRIRPSPDSGSDQTS